MAEICGKMMKILDLKYRPVSVKLVREGVAPPDGLARPQSRLSYCQAVVEASRGSSYFVTLRDCACADGASALGLMRLPDKIASGEVYQAIGNFLSREAAKRAIAAKPRLETGLYAGLAVSPLDRSTYDPDVVIIRATPEQAMWISSAGSYTTGDKIELLASGLNSACIECTVVPYLSNRINISLGCYGCRGRTELNECEMLVGIPARELNGLAIALERLSPLVQRTRSKEYLARTVPRT